MKISRKFALRARQSVASVNTYSYVGSTYVYSAVDQCAYYLPSPLCGVLDLDQMKTYVMSESASSSENTCKYLINSQTLSIEIASQSTAPINVHVYEYISRAVVPQNTSGIPTLTHLFNAGFSDSGTSTGHHELGLTPYQSTDFVTFCKITKVHKYLFQAGETKTITLKENKPRLINMARMCPAGATSNWMMFPERARGFIIRIHGTPTADSTTVNTVGIGSAKIGTVVRWTYKYSAVSDMTSTTHVVQSLPALPTPIVVSEQTGISAVSVSI